jgi:hypothetical protein
MSGASRPRLGGRRRRPTERLGIARHDRTLVCAENRAAELARLQCGAGQRPIDERRPAPSSDESFLGRHAVGFLSRPSQAGRIAGEAAGDFARPAASRQVANISPAR